MDVEIRYRIRTSSHSLMFNRWEQVEQPELADRLKYRYLEWERAMMERAAVHVLTERLGTEKAGGYSVSFIQHKEGLSGEG